MIKTELCEMAGIKYPIIQAGMGPYSTNRLAVAVNNLPTVKEPVERIVEEAGGNNPGSDAVSGRRVALIFSWKSPFTFEKGIAPRFLTRGVLNFQARESPVVRYSEMGLCHVLFVDIGSPFSSCRRADQSRMHYG